VSVIKSYFYHYEYETPKSYQHILFESMTGITGVILITTILLMAVTSLKFVRRRCFQVFGYSHMFLFPVFFTMLLLHG